MSGGADSSASLELDDIFGGSASPEEDAVARGGVPVRTYGSRSRPADAYASLRLAPKRVRSSVTPEAPKLESAPRKTASRRTKRQKPPVMSSDDAKQLERMKQFVQDLGEEFDLQVVEHSAAD